MGSLLRICEFILQPGLRKSAHLEWAEVDGPARSAGSSGSRRPQLDSEIICYVVYGFGVTPQLRGNPRGPPLPIYLFGSRLFGSGLFGSGLFGSGLFGFGLSSMLIMMRYLVALDKATPNLEGARCPGLFKSEQGHQVNTIPLTSRKLFCLALTFRKSVGCTVWYAGCRVPRPSVDTRRSQTWGAPF